MRALDREIMRLAVPAVVSNITVPLLGLSDTTISGHLGSEAYIGAISVGTMMMNVVFWLFAFLRMGTTGLTAQAYGAGDIRACRRVLVQAAVTGAVSGLLMIASQGPLLRLLLGLIEPEANVAGLSALYFRICIWQAPAVLATMSVLGWFLGMQDTVRPMVISIGVNVLNIILSVTLVFGFGMGFKGVALGTLASNWLGLALSVLLVVRFGGWSRDLPRPASSAHDGSTGMLTGISRFFKVNTDIFFRSACIMAVSLGMTAIGARIGTLALAANAVVMQFFILFSYFMDGLAFTGEALTGRYAGASDGIMLRRSIWRVVMWSAMVMLAFLAVYSVAPRVIVSLLTDRTEVVDYAMRLRPWIIAIPPLTVAAFVCDGFFIGLTSTRRMLVVTVVSAFVFFATALFSPGSAALVSVPSLTRLWTAFLLYLVCRGALLAFMLPAVVRYSVDIRKCKKN